MEGTQEKLPPRVAVLSSVKLTEDPPGNSEVDLKVMG